MTRNAALVIFRQGHKVAFLLRQNTGWRDGFYGLPSGKVEPGETFTEAAIREVREEVGVDIEPKDLTPMLTINLCAEDKAIWVNVVFEAQKWQGELYNAEPHKHERLDWFDLDSLPDNIVPIGHFYFDQIKAGNHYAEYGW